MNPIVCQRRIDEVFRPVRQWFGRQDLVRDLVIRNFTVIRVAVIQHLRRGRSILSTLQLEASARFCKLVWPVRETRAASSVSVFRLLALGQELCSNSNLRMFKSNFCFESREAADFFEAPRLKKVKV